MESPAEPVAPGPACEDVASPSDEVAERHWADTAVVLIVALVAAAASYGHMLHVAVPAGKPLWPARAFALTVDGLAVAALRRGTRAGDGWPSPSGERGGERWRPPPRARRRRRAPLVSAWPPLACSARTGCCFSADDRMVKAPSALYRFGGPRPRCPREEVEHGGCGVDCAPCGRTAESGSAPQRP
jgi:hypothetical protein